MIKRRRSWRLRRVSPACTTIHANNPLDAIARIETMAMMGRITLPEKAVRAQIASAVDLTVQAARMSDGARMGHPHTEVTEPAAKSRATSARAVASR